MTTFLVIWLWLSCYVMGVTMEAYAKDKQVSDMTWKDHLAWIIIAPVASVPVAAYFTFRRIFNV